MASALGTNNEGDDDDGMISFAKTDRPAVLLPEASRPRADVR